MIKTSKKIPEISDEELKTLSSKIRPVISCWRRNKQINEKELYSEPYRDIDGSNPNSEPYYLENEDDFKENPKTKNIVYFGRVGEKAEDIQHYASIRTYHHGFIPDVDKSATLAEILAQIPQEDLERIVAVETLDCISMEDPRLYKQGIRFEEAPGEGIHWATTKLYERK